MATFADRQRINREANRPAIKFNQRDNIRDFARSGHGQNYNRMMDIQRQLPNMDRNDPMVQEFKDRRRMLNRYGKNPMGEMLGYTPHEMMDKYVDLSRDVRQTNKPVYNKMYPLTGGFMDIAEKGGILGSILSEIVKMGKDGGLPTMIDDNEEDKQRYITETFGPHLENVPYGGPSPDEYEGPWPHEGLPVEARDIDIDRIPQNLDPMSQYPVVEGTNPRMNVSSARSTNLLEGPINIPYGYEENMLDAIAERNNRLGIDVVAPDVIEQHPIEYFEGPIEDFEEPLPFDQGKEDFIRSQNEYVSPPPVFPGNVRQDPQETDKWLRYLTAPELGSANPQGDFDKFQKYPFPKISVKFGADNREEPPPFNDDLREAGIASMMQSGLNLAGRRPYEDEYRAFVESSGPSKVMVTYEDFMEYYLPRIQESRGVLRAPLNSQGRR